MADGSVNEIISGLEARWPRWQCWYVPRVTGGPVWCARPWDIPGASRVINTGGPATLEAAIADADAALPPGDYAPHREAGRIARRFGWPWTVGYDPAARCFTARHRDLAEPLRYPDAATLEAELAAWDAAHAGGAPA